MRWAWRAPFRLRGIELKDCVDVEVETREDCEERVAEHHSHQRTALASSAPLRATSNCGADRRVPIRRKSASCRSKCPRDDYETKVRGRYCNRCVNTDSTRYCLR